MVGVGACSQTLEGFESGRDHAVRLVGDVGAMADTSCSQHRVGLLAPRLSPYRDSKSFQTWSETLGSLKVWEFRQV